MEIEITKREVIFSIVIIAIMIIVGISISGKINDKVDNKNEIYTKALQIEDEDIFKYSLETNVGNAFVYGEIKTEDTVSFPEISGEYMYIEKVTEEYRMHTKEVKHKDSEGNTYTTTEKYWQWDEIDWEEKKSSKASFLGVEFNLDQFNINIKSSHIDTIDQSRDKRYVYYGIVPNIKGTIFASLENNDIKNVKFFKDVDIQKAYELSATPNIYYLILFWFVWIILIAIIIYKFYYLENKWLY